MKRKEEEEERICGKLSTRQEEGLRVTRAGHFCFMSAGVHLATVVFKFLSSPIKCLTWSSIIKESRTTHVGLRRFLQTCYLFCIIPFIALSVLLVVAVVVVDSDIIRDVVQLVCERGDVHGR